MMGLAWCTCLYSVAPKDCGKVTWDPPRVGQIDRQTRVNALPFPILRMWLVVIYQLNKYDLTTVDCTYHYTHSGKVSKYYINIVFFANLFAATAGTNTRNATFNIVHTDLL